MSQTPTVETLVGLAEANRLMVAGIITPMEASMALQDKVTFDLPAARQALADKRVVAAPSDLTPDRYPLPRTVEPAPATVAGVPPKGRLSKEERVRRIKNGIARKKAERAAAAQESRAGASVPAAPIPLTPHALAAPATVAELVATAPDTLQVADACARFERLAMERMPVYDASWDYHQRTAWLLTLAEIAQMATPPGGQA